MKFLTFITLLSTLTLMAQTTQTYQTTVGAENRTYSVYIPASYQGQNANFPVVFNFHGYGSSMNEQLIYGDFRAIADTANFLIVVPNGTTVNGQNGWNTASTIAAFQKEKDFVQMMLNELASNYSINTARIYSTGMSNGGFMSYGLACFMNEKFAAIASVTGSMTGVFKNACTTTRPMPVLQIHGTDDAIVNYNGAFGIMSMDELTTFWKNKNKTKQQAEHTLKSNIVLTDNSTAEWYVWKDSLTTASVELFKINNGGHTWPGALFPVSGNTNMDINASVEIWRFFSKYQLNNELNTMILNPITSIPVFVDQEMQQLVIETEILDDLSLIVLDISGKVLKEVKLETMHKIDVSSLHKGVYLYKLIRNQQLVQSGRVIKY